jgi:hypothetical protein
LPKLLVCEDFLSHENSKHFLTPTPAHAQYHEYKFVFMITDFITGDATYIGGSDGDNEGTWTWLDGEPFTYSKWGESEPNGNVTENCLEITYSMDWNDIYCGGQDYKYYICETPLSKSFL